MLLIGLSMFFFGVVSLIFVRKHFLMSLLSLEFLLLSIFMVLFFFLSFYSFDFFFLIVYLILSVCDGVLGLSLIVYLVRKLNTDFVDSISLF
nr:NADH dehydrogenase subunit 4L [Acanalonia sp.]